MSLISQTSLFEESRVVLKNLGCDSSVVVGDWVRMNNAGVLVKAKADNYLNSRVLGLVEDKADSTTATVLVAGLSKEIFNSLNIGTYYLSLSTEGGMIQSIVTAPSSVILTLGQSITATRFMVMVDKGLQRSV